jgi:hypothetical protein
MYGNVLTQRFLAFPDHGHLRFSPSHNKAIVSRGLLRSDDGLPMPNAPPPECHSSPAALHSVGAVCLATVHQS